jgi:hypothetical protein
MWSSGGGGGRVVPRGEEVGEGPGPIGRRRAADNGLTSALMGGTRVSGTE